MILEIVIFFALLLVSTMILALLPATIRARFWIGCWKQWIRSSTRRQCSKIRRG